MNAITIDLDNSVPRQTRSLRRHSHQTEINMTITPNDIYNLIHKGESTSVEIKKCSDSVPRSVWETYSAFANTRGGVILLGVTEHKDRPLESRFEITGVSDSEKIETDFFNMLNNRRKLVVIFYSTAISDRLK